LNELRVYGEPAAAGSVPESVSWAMMVAGFGAVGGALQGRRNTAVSLC